MMTGVELGLSVLARSQGVLLQMLCMYLSGTVKINVDC